ncbi:unnamed protein product [Mycena citricolor]|uniref:Polynucleotide 5'-hydroxyl-kinase GRC3 n=1 Tax=Mycena citricolor TaxID=2018698 RepID=A0AAD2Q5W3_9AGAR|nr:unnamed protein product [Mycena citricolor]
MASEESHHETREWTLDPETEYRFELDPGTSLAIKLIRGNAEVFGAELAPNKHYLFGQECKAAIFTWRGCTIEMSLVYDGMRVRALRDLRGSPVPDFERDKPSDPPRVLVVGPENSGKTSLCKILINYAVRAGQGWSPLLVNVDPSEGGWAAPGTLSVAPIQTPLPTSSPGSPLGSAATSAPTALSSNALVPLAYWYGHPEIKRNPLLMERIIRNLGQAIEDRYQVDAEGKCRTAGLVVDTPSSFAPGPGNNDSRQKLISSCVEAFKINVILVVGHEKLNVELQRAYGNRITVVKIPKSGGVVELDHLYRQRVHMYQLHTYMYGQKLPLPAGITSASLGGETVSDLILSPSSTIINFDDLSIFRIGAETMAPSSALPIGAARTVSETQSVPIDPASPGSGLLNAVLAIVAPLSTDESERYDEELLDQPISGYLVMSVSDFGDPRFYRADSATSTNVDIPQRKLTVLSPNHGSITGRTAITGSFEWQE